MDSQALGRQVIPTQPISIGELHEATATLAQLQEAVDQPNAEILRPPHTVPVYERGRVIGEQPGPSPRQMVETHIRYLNELLALIRPRLHSARLFATTKYRAVTASWWGDLPADYVLAMVPRSLPLPDDFDQQWFAASQHLKRLAHAVSVKQQRLREALQLIEHYPPEKPFFCRETNIRHPRATLRSLAAEPSPLLTKTRRLADGAIWQFQPRKEAA